MVPVIILASTSPRRRMILKKLKIPFEVVNPAISERLNITNPVKYVKTAAELKAKVVSLKRRGLIVGVDTVVVIDNKILGKPETRKEARAMIQRLSGRKHKVLSAVFLIDSKTGRQWQAIEKTAVKFRRLGPAEIESYIRSSEPYDKAGGYAIQGQAGLFVEWIDGCYWNVVGFPISSFLSLLKKSGYF